MADILKGAPVAQAINQKSAEALSALTKRGIVPTLAILRVGQREDDIAYEQSTVKRCEKLGVGVKSTVLPADVTQEELMAQIDGLNRNPKVHGILVFMPLPKHLDSEAARQAISPQKDVDGVTDSSLAGVFTGSGRGFSPCTAQACVEILDHYGIDCAGTHAVVVGRSLVVGRPVAMLLMAKNATVTICHTKTADMPALTRSGEILIVATGKPKSVGAEHFAPGQTVIDVGINFVDGAMCGDADFNAGQDLVGAITPGPGGVGTVTSAVLVSHVIEASQRQNL